MVQHQARKYGNTKFGMERFVRGFLDLITISFLSRFGKRPMHLFGAWGAIMLFVGFCFALYLGIDKLFIHPTGRLITDRPQFYISLTAMILGSQFFCCWIFRGTHFKEQKKSKELYYSGRNLDDLLC